MAESTIIQCPPMQGKYFHRRCLTHQIEEKVKKGFEAAQQIKEQELSRKSEALKKQENEIAENKKNMDSAIAQKVAEQLATEKQNFFKEAKAIAEKEQSAKTAFLEDQLKKTKHFHTSRYDSHIAHENLVFA